MSNTLAIAAVTSAMKYVLNEGLSLAKPDEVNGASITTWRPAQLADSGTVDNDANGLNVYLYQVTPNHAWNLTDLPTRHRDGSIARRPLTALDLHYLVTAYGKEDALEPQRLLATAALALAKTPVFTKDVIADAIAMYDVNPTDFLVHSDLPDQPELVKVSPTPLSLEELSKLWGVLGTPYLLSVAYTATVVLIEAPIPVRRALPVRRFPVIDVQPFSRVVLADVSVLSADGTPAPASTGRTLVLTGSGLLSARTRVDIGRVALIPTAQSTVDRIETTLTDAVPAGVHPVQVVQTTPADPIAGTPERISGRSRALPLVVVPTVGPIAVIVDGGGIGFVSVSVTPPLREGQRATVSFARLAGGNPDEPALLDASFPPLSADDAPKTSLDVKRSLLTKGTWLVRVTVDGAESVPTSTGETYDGPTVVLA